MNILVMNASGPKSGNANERKAVISKILKKDKPDVVLFQEFAWKDLRADHWKENKIPKNYNIVSQEDNTSEEIVYNTKTVKVMYIRKSLTDYVLRHFPPNFKPLERLSMSLIVDKRNKNLGFICVSWHGHYKISPSEKKEHVQCLIQFVKEIGYRYNTPVLVGGDFNIGVDRIAEIVEEEGSFEICRYKSSERRKQIIDVLIKSKSPVFRVFDTKYVDLKKDNYLFDHDPITCVLRYDVDTRVWKMVEEKINYEYFFQFDYAVSFALKLPKRQSFPSPITFRKASSSAGYSHVRIYGSSTSSERPSLSEPRITKFYDKLRDLKIVIVTMTDRYKNPYHVVCIYNGTRSFQWFWSDLTRGRKYAENIISSYIMNSRGGNRGTLGILKTEY